MSTGRASFDRRVVALAVLVIVVVLAVAAGCGGNDSDPDPMPTVATNTEAPSNGDGPDGDDNGDSGEFNACSLITQEEVMQALGEEVTEGVQENADPFFSCRFESEDFDSVSVSYVTGEREDIEEYFELGNEESETIEGLGERAYWDEDFNDLEVLTGVQYLSVSISADGVDEFEVARSLAERALGRLP